MKHAPRPGTKHESHLKPIEIAHQTERRNKGKASSSGLPHASHLLLVDRSSSGKNRPKNGRLETIRFLVLFFRCSTTHPGQCTIPYQHTHSSAKKSSFFGYSILLHMLVRSFVALLISGASCGSVSLCSLRTHTKLIFFRRLEKAFEGFFEDFCCCWASVGA